MSTRKLIIAALLCGLAILVAFTIQLTQAVHDRPPAVSTTR
jgi:hypothetical protein